ncbi:MAG: hypothetical protein AB7S26_29905 [Sandaracinaceae bacterium]
MVWSILIVGCHPPLTEIVVDVTTDQPIPSGVHGVRLDVDASAIEGGVERREVQLSAASELPARFVLVHEGGPLGPIAIRATALFDGPGPPLDRSETVWFQTERTVIVPVELSDACRMVRCGRGEHCAGGVCVGGVDVDAGTIVDAGMCLATTCDAACSCAMDGCPCALACPAGSACEPTCEEDCTVDARSASRVRVGCDGVACTVDATGANEVEEVACEHEATCEVDCRGTSRCRVKCKSESQCLLRCDVGADCRIDDCMGASSLDCGDGVLACRRACP